MDAFAHIGPSICITGEVTAQEPLTIAGCVVGTIDVTGYALTVTEAARIDADVLAHTIIIGGNVNGKLNAADRIVLRRTAMVEGNVSAPAVAVDDGARMQGRMEVAGRRPAA